MSKISKIFLSLIVFGFFIGFVYFVYPKPRIVIFLNKPSSKTAKIFLMSRFDSIIDEQLEDFDWRQSNPPTFEEKQRMENESSYCNHHDDCRRNPEILRTTCNTSVANKYYCEKHGCFYTEKFCYSSELVSDVCVNNQCQEKVIMNDWPDLIYKK